MCALAADYKNINLEEETEPFKRLVQVLNEAGVNGKLRDLLLSHYKNHNEPSWLRSIQFEEIVRGLNLEASDQAISVEFWTKLSTLSGMSLSADISQIICESDLKDPYRIPSSLIPLLNEICKAFFNDSVLDIYRSNISKTIIGSSGFGYFSLCLRGREYLRTKEFFEQSAKVEPLVEYRAKHYFHLLNNFLPIDARLDLDDPYFPVDQLSVFLSAARAISNFIILNKQESEYNEALQFIKAWVIAESSMISNDDFLWQLTRPFINLAYSQPGENRISPVGSMDSIYHSLKDFIEDIELLFLSNARLADSSAETVNYWAEKMDSVATLYKSRYLRFHVGHDERYPREQANLNWIISNVDSSNLELWIKWTVKFDIEKMLAEKNPSYGQSFIKSKKWFCTSASSKCKQLVESTVAQMPMSEQTDILSFNMPSIPEPYLRDVDAWWTGLLRSLIKLDNFPRNLIPKWAVSAVDKFNSDEELVPYLDQAIGILRSMSKSEWTSEYDAMLKRLLEGMSCSYPEKALKHRLLIMRSVCMPVTDGSLSLYHSSAVQNHMEWYRSLRDLAQQWVSISSRSMPFDGSRNHDEEYMELLRPFVLGVIDFCLGRFHFRRKEKAKDGKYEEHQIIESDPLWREAYIKVLQELCLDPKGKVHKALHFIKTADPNADVRAAAKEAYKAVRRGNEPTTGFDMRRGIVAADWWLHLCQRKSLNQPVLRDESIQTRRRLMRNP